MPRHPGKGRRKAEMKAIEKPEARQVCFSKRRQGLFKKASELSVLCGAHVGTIVFSPAGRAYSFGSPSIEAVLDRYLSGTAGPLPTPRLAAASASAAAAGEPGRARAEEELKLPRLWDADIKELGLEELKEYEKALMELQGEIETRTFQALASTASPKGVQLSSEADGSTSAAAADDLVDEQPASPKSDAVADHLSLSAEESYSGQGADDGNFATEKYAWLSLLPPGQQPPGFW